MKFSDKQVYEAAVKAVEARGEDYVYPKADGSCVYGVNGEPSCLVGQIVYNLDPDLFVALETEDVRRRRDAEDTDASNMPLLRKLFTKKQVEVLTRSQRYQDQGYWWGTAFQEFSALDMRDDTRGS